MPITSYYTQEELVENHQKAIEGLSKSTREALDEVRSINPNFYLSHKTIIRGFIWNTKSTNLFSLLIRISGDECQIYNFPSSGEFPGSSINTYVTEQVLEAYLMGIINGYAFAKKLI